MSSQVSFWTPVEYRGQTSICQKIINHADSLFYLGRWVAVCGPFSMLEKLEKKKTVYLKEQEFSWPKIALKAALCFSLIMLPLVPLLKAYWKGAALSLSIIPRALPLIVIFSMKVWRHCSFAFSINQSISVDGWSSRGTFTDGFLAQGTREGPYRQLTSIGQMKKVGIVKEEGTFNRDVLIEGKQTITYDVDNSLSIEEGVFENGEPKHGTDTRNDFPKLIKFFGNRLEPLFSFARVFPDRSIIAFDTKENILRVVHAHPQENDNSIVEYYNLSNQDPLTALKHFLLTWVPQDENSPHATELSRVLSSVCDHPHNQLFTAEKFLEFVFQPNQFLQNAPFQVQLACLSLAKEKKFPLNTQDRLPVIIKMLDQARERSETGEYSQSLALVLTGIILRLAPLCEDESSHS